MALDKLVDSTQLDADLTTVANAIRSKGGTSAELSFPSGMAAAIGAIPTGAANFKKFNVTLPTVFSGGDLTLVSGDADVAAHYADNNAIVLFYPASYKEIETTRNAIFASIVGNTLLRKKYDGTDVYGASPWLTSTALGGFSHPTKLSTHTSYTGHLRAKSSGDITIYVGGTYDLLDGDYYVLFMW